MEPLEHELKDALSRRTPMPAADLTRLTSRVNQEYAQKQRTVRRLTHGYLAVMVLAMAMLFWFFMESNDPKLSLLYGICILIMFEGTVLMKLWFWVLHGKIATVRELKLLQLMIAERLPLPADAPPQSAGLSAEAESSPTAPPTTKRAAWPWRALVIAVWLISVAGFCYCVWLQQDAGLKNALLCYEKTVPATESAPAERTDTFDLQKPCERFHARLVPASGHAEVRIAVGRQGGDYFYDGPLSDISRIYFGEDLAPGKYWIRTKGGRTNAGYTLRLYGVNRAQQTSQPQSYLVMIFSAVAVIIPLLWLQKRWVKKIDPELAR